MILIVGKTNETNTSDMFMKFQKAENDLHQLDLMVINPAKLGFPASWSNEDKSAKLMELIYRKVTAIYLLLDWADDPVCQRLFIYVHEIKKQNNKEILIYFEKDIGLRVIRSEIREGFLTCLIPNTVNS